ncbi:MAG TPA: ABC transporter permease [Planctomycetota bacterium]|jgi:putative ABC transport system permease protein|nr:ABC transporter permease [Planctomycetota bacterium]
MPIPWQYNIRSVFYRKAATLFTVAAVALTVAILVILLAVGRGFTSAVSETGSIKNIVCMRNGATSEGESIITRDQLNTLGGLPGVARDEGGAPLIAGEMYAAVSLERVGGGATNIPVRGVSASSFLVRDTVKLIDGRLFTPGSREVVVGESVLGRIEGCQVGGSIRISKDPWSVVGVISDGGRSFSSEIWGDAEVLLQAFNRTAFNVAILRIAEGTDLGGAPTYEGPVTSRVQVKPGTGMLGSITERMGEIKAMSERDYFASQSGFLGGTIQAAAIFLTFLMSLGALAGCTNTLLAAVSGRRREIGGLLSIGYRPVHIFLGFLLEAVLLCLVGGIVGILLAMPFRNIRTGTTNWQTFTEQSFQFQIDATVIAIALALAIAVGLIGGVLPAWRACRLKPVDALRRG